MTTISVPTRASVGDDLTMPRAEGQRPGVPAPLLPAPARFPGAVVLVTGASSGVGAAAAKLFAAEGALVVAADASPDHRVVDTIVLAGGSATCVHEDLRLPDAERLLVSDVLEIYGRLDILIHTGTHTGPNAFRTGPTTIPTIRSDLHASSRIARVALPAMRRTGGGSMLFTSAIAADHERQSAAEHLGFPGLIRRLAARYASAGVRVNAVHPVRTVVGHVADDATPSSRSAVDALRAAAGLAYLASSEARSTTGLIMTVGSSSGSGENDAAARTRTHRENRPPS